MGKGSLLIVEDENEIRSNLAEVLEEYAEHVYTAANGIEALEVLFNRRIDCIVSDIQMPDLNGVDLLKELHRRSIKQPFIFYTAYGTEQMFKELKEFGLYAMVGKPDTEKLEKATKMGLIFGVDIGETSKVNSLSKNEFDELVATMIKSKEIK